MKSLAGEGKGRMGVLGAWVQVATTGRGNCLQENPREGAQSFRTMAGMQRMELESGETKAKEVIKQVRVIHFKVLPLFS